MKKILILITNFLIACSLVGCSNNKELTNEEIYQNIKDLGYSFEYEMASDDDCMFLISDNEEIQWVYNKSNKYLYYYDKTIFSDNIYNEYYVELKSLQGSSSYILDPDKYTLSEESINKLKESSDNNLEKIGIDQSTLEKILKIKLEDAIEKKENEKKLIKSLDKEFNAKGSTGLMTFLTNASNNSYDIADPNRDGNTVTASVNHNDNIINGIEVKYYVEEQKIYNVIIYANTSEIFNSQIFKDCSYAMAKSINPNLTIDKIKEEFNKAKENNGKSVYENTLFLINDESKTYSIAY